MLTKKDIDLENVFSRKPIKHRIGLRRVLSVDSSGYCSKKRNKVELFTR